jgi:hypothetical protein
MGTLPKAYERDNLERAWRWIRSNSDAAFKSYFRAAYSRYALADAVLLDDLQDRLERGGICSRPCFCGHSSVPMDFAEQFSRDSLTYGG